MNGFFQEISRTNAAYCRSLGLDSDTYDRQLSDAEANGTPLSPEEELIANERRWLVNRGMDDAKAAVWAPINVRHGVSNQPHATVEYARPRSMWDQKNIQPYYDECRARSGQRAGAFVGD